MFKFLLLLCMRILIIEGNCHDRNSTLFKPKPNQKLPETISNQPAVQHPYTPIGHETFLDELVIYETGNKNSKQIIICAYDIFGYHTNAKQFADILAKLGNFLVVMPHFFRGTPWKLEKYPIKNQQEFLKWRNKYAAWEIVKADLVNVINLYSKNGTDKEFGIYGFCWGGKIAIQAGANFELPLGAALIHPTGAVEEEAQKVNCPVLFIASNDDPDLVPFHKIVETRLGKGKSEHYRYNDTTHGFAGAIGDYGNPVIQKRVSQSIQYIYKFFKKNSSK